MATTAELKQRVRKFVDELLAEQARVTAKPGVALFTTIEDLACELGDTFAQEVMRYEAAHRDEPPHYCCPQCGQLGQRKGEEERVITSCRGPVEVIDVECYCKRCRKSFFPSRGQSGTGSGL
jgi:hypothetical protein